MPEKKKKNGSNKTLPSNSLAVTQEERAETASDAEPFFATIGNYEELEFRRALTSDPIWPVPFVIRDGAVHRVDTEKYDIAHSNGLEAKLAKLKATGFFKRVCNNENYKKAVKAINKRFKRAKNERYRQPWAEVRLLEIVYDCYTRYELLGTLKADEKIPRVDDLHKLRSAIEKASRLSFQYSSVLPELGLGGFFWEISHHIERLEVFMKTYRKRRSDAHIREILFAENVAIQLNKKFGVCEYSVHAEICGLVGYAVERSTLTALAKAAITRNEEFAKFDRSEKKRKRPLLILPQ
jgi:hypothetical protein